MELIAITVPYFYPGEARDIAGALAENRFRYVHVRKPGCSAEEMRGLLEQIPDGLRDRLALHDFHELAGEYGIGGIHLNSRNPAAPEGWKGRTSRSIHTLEEIGSVTEDYAFLSPIFPSISKPGYRGAFILEEISRRLTPGIFALGGVTPERLPQLEAAGFAGAAMLGAAWHRKIDREAFRLQFITNGHSIEEVTEGARKAVEGGCRWVQVRMKDATKGETEEAVRRLAPLRERYGITLLVDDHVDMAARLDCLDGVHVGKNDMPVAEARRQLGPGKILGATANTYDDLKAAVEAGADYVGLGPFRFTTTKKNLSPVLGTEGYRRILAQCREEGMETPVVAIGGITESDIPQVMQTGVAGIAVSGSILRAADPVAETARLISTIETQKLKPFTTQQYE